jgi:hypothetical protein
MTASTMGLLAPGGTQLEALDLAAGGLRQRVDVVHGPGVGVRGELGLDQLLQLLGEGVVAFDAWAGDDVRLENLAAQLVGGGDDCALDHVGVRHEDALHLEGPIR